MPDPELEADGTPKEMGIHCTVIQNMNFPRGLPASPAREVDDLVEGEETNHTLSWDQKCVTVYDCRHEAGQWGPNDQHNWGFATVSFMPSDHCINLAACADIVFGVRAQPGCTCQHLATEKARDAVFAVSPQTRETWRSSCAVGGVQYVPEAVQLWVYADRGHLEEFEHDRTSGIGTVGELLTRLESPQCRQRWA
jgi:hypothetical protein